MNAHADIGHNNPPDPIDEALAPYGDFITEAENWLDGAKVENDIQMAAVDVLLKEIKSALKDVKAAQKEETEPLHATWKAAIARYKPTLEDLDHKKKGLTSAVGDYKKAKAAAIAEAKRKAFEEAEEKRREAEAAMRKANPANLEESRSASTMLSSAIEAEEAAKGLQADAPKGLRTVHKYEITDHRALLNWIAQNRRDDLTQFIEDWAAKNHKNLEADGIKTWTDKEAF